MKALSSILSDVPRETLGKLVRYSELVMQWNQRINLTGAKTVNDFWKDQILDCLSAAHTVVPHSIWIDVGSGAGLPGIVWALLFPETQFYLLEAREKRVSFLYRVASQLQLQNVKIIHERFENLVLQNHEDLNSTKEVRCVSRGTAAPHDLLRLASGKLSLWKQWYIFVSKETSPTFLSESALFHLKAEIISYPLLQPPSPDKGLNPKGFLCVIQPSGPQ